MKSIVHCTCIKMRASHQDMSCSFNWIPKHLFMFGFFKTAIICHGDCAVRSILLAIARFNFILDTYLNFWHNCVRHSCTNSWAARSFVWLFRVKWIFTKKGIFAQKNSFRRKIEHFLWLKKKVMKIGIEKKTLLHKLAMHIKKRWR